MNHVARWDRTNWSPLGTGTSEAGHQGVAVGSDLYVSGEFKTAGGVPVNQPPFLEVHNGQAQLHFREPQVIPGRGHEIRLSRDLRGWETVERRYAGPTGGIDLTHPRRPGGPRLLPRRAGGLTKKTTTGHVISGRGVSCWEDPRDAQLNTPKPPFRTPHRHFRETWHVSRPDCA